MLEILFLRIATLSLTCSVVLLPLLLLSRRIHHRYAAKTCYFLWLLLAVRLVLPIQITLPTPAVTVEAPSREVTVIRPANSSPQAAAAIPAPMPVEGPAAPVPSAAPAAPARALSAAELLAGLWLAGGVAYGLYQAAAYGAARRRLLRRASPAGLEERILLETLKTRLGCTRRVVLCRAEGVDTPMMLGLLRPVILLPRQALAPRALSLVLCHELTHLKRWDVAYKLLLLAANGVHWFNPLAWWMAREGARNLELCCDDDVVRNQGESFRRMYGEILLDTAAGAGRAPALSTQFSGKEQLKERLKNLFKQKKNSAALVCLILAVTVLCGSLVVCRAAGTAGRVSEEEAIDMLEASIRYDPGTGRLSFAIPEVETPSQPWQLRIAGRAEFDGGMGMSLHYHTDTQWEPGGNYDEDLSQVAGALTELTMDVTLGITQRSIDLMAWIRGEGGLRSGRYEMAIQAGDEGLFAPVLTLDTGARTFVFCSDPASSYLARGSYTVSNGLLTASTGDGVYQYVFRVVDGDTLAFVAGQSSKVSTYLAAEVYDGALFVNQAAVYRNEAYGFTLALPSGWPGKVEVEEEAGGTLVTFYQSSARQADDPTAGVIMSLCVCTREDFEALYGDKDLDGIYAGGGPRIIVLGNTAGGQIVYLHIDQTDAQDGLARMRREAAAITPAAFARELSGGPVYKNETYGFTLVLPESWAGHWKAVDTSGDQSGDFYGDVAFYCTAVGGETGGLLMELGVWPVERQELLGRERLLGHTDGCWVYLYYPQTDLPALAQAEEADALLYDMMYEDGARLPEDFLTFRAGAGPLVYENDFYGFILYLPENWADQGEITEIGNDEVRLKYSGFGGGIYGNIASLVIQREPLQELTARIRLLSSQEGCYVYLSMSQTSWPEDAGQDKIDEYVALYDAIEALTVEDLVFFDPSPADPEVPPANTPEAIAQKWLDERVARFVEFDYNYTDFRLDSLEYAWTAGDYKAYRFQYSIRQGDRWIRDYEQTPHLILYQDSLYDVKFLADPAAPGPYQDAGTALRAVLLEQEGFYDANTGAHTMLSQLDVSDNPAKTAAAAIKSFAVADLDRDGTPEVILERAQYPESAYLILRYEDGNVYGYEAYYRWFMPLKADGTIHFSSSAAEGGYGRLLFAGGAMLTDYVSYSAAYGGWDVMAYFVDKAPATQEQLQAAYRRIESQSGAVWYEFTGANVRTALG